MPDWTASTGGHHSDTLTADPDAATDTATTAPDPHAATQPHSTVSFFANLLNPALVHDPAFAYTNASPYTMASSRPHPARLSNGYVDLTSPHLDLTPHVDLTDFTPHVDLTDPDPPSRRRNRDSPTPGPSSKRLKRAHGTAAESPTTTPPAAPIEQIDLLNKQREDAIKAQPRPVETVTTFNSFTCVICMDRPIDITATACGHLFCHTCLMEALIAGENRTGPGEVKRSQCPVCRKTISRSRATDVIPLLLKKGLATQPRRKPDAIPAATLEVQ